MKKNTYILALLLLACLSACNRQTDLTVSKWINLMSITERDGGQLARIYPERIWSFKPDGELFKVSARNQPFKGNWQRNGDTLLVTEKNETHRFLILESSEEEMKLRSLEDNFDAIFIPVEKAAAPLMPERIKALLTNHYFISKDFDFKKSRVYLEFFEEDMVRQVIHNGEVSFKYFTWDIEIFDGMALLKNKTEVGARSYFGWIHSIDENEMVISELRNGSVTQVKYQRKADTRHRAKIQNSLNCTWNCDTVINKASKGNPREFAQDLKNLMDSRQIETLNFQFDGDTLREKSSDRRFKRDANSYFRLGLNGTYFLTRHIRKYQTNHRFMYIKNFNKNKLVLESVKRNSFIHLSKSEDCKDREVIEEQVKMD